MNLVWIEIISISIFTIIVIMVSVKNKYKDMLFFVYLIIFYAYHYFFPLKYLMDNDMYIYNYLKMQILIFIFFILIFIFVYKYLNNKVTCLYYNLNYVVDRKRVLVFLLFIVFITVMFIDVSLNYNLFFRRIGHQALMNHSLDVPMFKLMFYRLFEDTGIFISLIFSILLKKMNKNNKKLYIISYFIFYIYICTLLSYQLINSRMQILLFLISHLILNIMYYKKFSYKKIFYLSVLGFLLVFSVLFFRSWVVLGSNANFQTTMEELSKEKSSNSRLNGIHILAKVDAADKDFMIGVAWEKPIMVMVYSIIDREEAIKIKMNLETNAKVNIMRYYLSLDIPDIPSSVLTDVYPNFSFIGIFMAAIFISFLIFNISKNLYMPNNTFKFYLALYMLPLIIQVEKEFISLVIMIIKYSMTFWIIYLIQPIKLKVSKNE